MNSLSNNSFANIDEIIPDPNSSPHWTPPTDPNDSPKTPGAPNSNPEPKPARTPKPQPEPLPGEEDPIPKPISAL